MADLVDELGIESQQLEKAAAQIRASLQSILDKAKELNNVSLKFGDYTAGVGEFKKVSQEATTIQGQLQNELTNLSKTLNTVTNSRKAATSATNTESKAEAELTKQTGQTNKVKQESSKLDTALAKSQANKSKSSQAESKALADTNAKYRQLQLTLEKLQVDYKVLISSMGQESAASKKAAIEIDQLKSKVAQLNTQLEGSAKSSGVFKSAFSNIGGIATSILAATGLTAGIMGAVNFIQGSINESLEREQTASRLKNTLDNLGNTGEAFDRLIKKADDLHRVFKTYDNDDIIGVFQQLIQYGKLTEKQIDELTPVIVNLATRQGLSLSESSDIIIKALQGNSRELKKFGINIKEADSTTEAFGIIMSQLAPRLEGVNDAFQKTSQGIQKIAQVDIKDLQEQIGDKLQPAMKAFYEFISGALSGIGNFWTSMKDRVERATDLISAQASTIKNVFVDLFTLKWGDIGKDMHGISDELDRQSDAQKRASQVTLAKTTVDALSTRTLKEQVIAYQNLEKRWQVAADKVKELARANQLETKEGREAALWLHVQTVKREELNKVIAESVRQKNEANKTLGFGGTDEFKTPTTGKTGKDQTLEDNQAILHDTMETNKILAEDYNNLSKFRYDAARQAFDATNNLIDLEVSHEKKSIVEATIARRKALEDYGKTIDKIAADIYKLKQSTTEVITPPKSDEDAYKEQLAAHQKFVNDFRAQVKKGGEAILVDIANNQFDEEGILQAQRDNDLISETEFRKKLAEVKKKYAIQSLDAVIAAAKGEQSGMDILSNAYAELTKKINEAIAAKKKLAEDSTPASGLEKLKEDLDKAAEVVGVLTQALDDLYSIGYNNQKTALEEIGAQQDKNYEREVENITNSKISEEDKANRLTILDKQHQAQQEQNARKQQELDNKKAKFDREVAIFNIIINTARAVIAALVSTPPNIPLSIAVGIAGAAQLAVAIATKVPQLYTGTKSAKEGYALTDEKGAELYIEPDGSMKIGNDYPTLRYLKGGTEVVRHDMVHQVLYNAMIKNTASALQSSPLKEDKEIPFEKFAAMIVRGFSKSRPVVNNNVDIGEQLKFKSWVDKNVRGRA